MEGLRTIAVLEHETIPVREWSDPARSVAEVGLWLTEAEAQELLRLNEMRKGFCERRPEGVKLAQYCGVVRLSTCVLEVLPKVGVSDARLPGEVDSSRGALLAMLHSARRVSITKMGTVPQESVQAPLLDIFIEAFLHCALEQARRGLLSRYMVHAEDLPVIKGRFHAQGHARRNASRPHMLHCEYDEFTIDNVYNRSIRAALVACLGWIRTTATQRLWYEAHARYGNVSSVKMSADDVARLPHDRTTRRYTDVLTWCQSLLGMVSPAMSKGATAAPGLLFDMNKLFEAHAARLEEAGAGPNRIVNVQGPPLHLASHGKHEIFLLKPDITIWSTDSDGNASSIDRVVDAKWKRISPRAMDLGVDEADIYQLLAYALRYGCKTVELAYPMPRDAELSQSQMTFNIPLSGRHANDSIAILVKFISLWE